MDGAARQRGEGDRRCAGKSLRRLLRFVTARDAGNPLAPKDCDQCAALASARRAGCDTVCCPGEHRAGACWGCPYEEEAALWNTITIIRSCTTKVNGKGEAERWGLSPEGFNHVFDHPRIFGIKDEVDAYRDVQRGLAWLNGDE